MPLESILSVAKAIQDLLGICCNEPPTVTSFSVRDEKAEPRLAKVYVRIWGNDDERSKGRPNAALGLEDLGGIGVVEQWIRERERCGAVVELLTSNWYNDGAYNEDKFSRMYAAVESLMGKKRHRSTARMKSAELANFVEAAIPDFSSITNRPSGDRAKDVKEIRDKRISHSDPTSTVVTDGRTMHVMTNVLYIAGASFLLREMGVGENQVEEYMARCSRSLLLSEQQ